MDTKVCIEYPRMLIISNNAFSDTTNNGKTLASFFDEYPAGKIAQLYFNPEEPTITRYNNYFRIMDMDVVRSVVKKSNACGKKISGNHNLKDNKVQKETPSLVTIISKNNLARIAREVLWKSMKWKTKELDDWLNEFSPEVIFLCAGDSGFAYDITKYVQDKYGSKLVVYITDDYVLPRKTLSPFWWWRRNQILDRMKETVQKSDLFITISQQMRKVYAELLGKDSILAVNMTNSMKDGSISAVNNGKVTLVYAGGFHFKRYVTLRLLAQSLKKYNDSTINEQKAYLKIYSGQEPNRKVLKYLNLEGVSKYCGKLSSVQLKEVLNSCDIPVHVESFDKKSIESTRLSISTKIPEYLSLGKAILAIGPNQVASMEYLNDTAFCITHKDSIYFEIKKLLDDKELRVSLSKKSLIKYSDNHIKENNSKQLLLKILEIY
jgi:hypothetical protein